MEPATKHSVPGSFALQLIDLLRRWEVTAEELLEGSGFTCTDLEEPRARLSIETLCKLLERARTLTGEPGLGFYLGLQKRITMYGYLGFAAMNAATMGEALELALRYAPTIATGLSLRLRTERGVAALIVEEQCDLGSSRDIALLSFLVGLASIGDALTGRVTQATIEIAMREPPYYRRFAHAVPRLRFGETTNQIIFDAKYLDLPLITPDRAAMRLATEQCEQELLALGLTGNVVERIHHLMLKPGGPDSFEELARALHMSPRTLRRRLSAQGITFSALRARVCCERATVLLRSRELALEAIAHELGYATLSGFVRAFQRWTGKTPAAYRRERLAQEGSTPLRSFTATPTVTRPVPLGGAICDP